MVISKIRLSIFIICSILYSQSIHPVCNLSPPGAIGAAFIEDPQTKAVNQEGELFYLPFNKIKVSFYLYWYVKDKVRIEVDKNYENVIRMYPAERQTNSCLEFTKTDDTLKLVYLHYEDGKISARLGDFSVGITDVKNLRLGSLENYNAGKRFVDLVNNIPYSKGRRQHIYAYLQNIAKAKSALKKQVKFEVFVGLFNFYFKSSVKKSITPVSLIRDRFESTRFFAFIDEIDPSNYIVGEVDGKRIIIYGRDKNEILTKEKMEGKKRISLNNFGEGRLFYESMQNWCELNLLKVDKRAGQRIDSATSFTRKIGVKLHSDIKAQYNRFWITRPGELKHKQIYPHYLIDMKKFAQYKQSGAWPSTLREIDNSKGKFIALKYQKGRKLVDWMGYTEGKSYKYYYKVGEIFEKEETYYVYRRIDKEDCITVAYISEDQRTFTIEGLTVNNKPVIFEADRIHLSALLYLFKNYFNDVGNLDISISDSLERLIPDYDDIVAYGQARIPTLLSVKKSNGDAFYMLSGASNYKWVKGPALVRSDSHKKTVDDQMRAIRWNILNSL